MTDVSMPRFRNVKLKKLTIAVNHLLEAAFSLEDIWEAMKKFDGNKAPGLDGFSLDFFKNSGIS